MAPRTERILWLSGFPSHYVRELHLRLAGLFDKRIVFVYLPRRDIQRRRAYEQGGIPESSVVVPEGFRATFMVLRAIRLHNPGTVVIHSLHPRAKLWAAILCLLQRRRVLYWNDTNLLDVLNEPRKKRWLKLFLLPLILKRMNMLLYIGARNRDFYLWTCGRQAVANKLLCVPYPHLSDRFPWTPIMDRGQEAPMRLLYLGRLSRDKAVDNLVLALTQLDIKSVSSVRLTLAGDGPVRNRLEMLVRKHGLDGRVEFLGAIPSDRAPDVIANHDVLVLPSHKEPWGLVVNEALSSGRPVILPYWVGAAADLIVDNVNGIVLENNDPGSIAAAIHSLLQMRARLPEMGLNCRRAISAKAWSIDAAFGQLRLILDAPFPGAESARSPKQPTPAEPDRARPTARAAH